MSKIRRNVDSWDGGKIQILVPNGYVPMRQWCQEHGISYSLIYSRINQRKVQTVRRGGKYFVLDCMDPEQFRQGNRHGWDYDNGRVAQRAAAIEG